MSRNDKLNQFDDLIDELQRNDKRPSTPRVFKNGLRNQLLNQYEERTLSAQATWNLWRFAGGVAGVLLLVMTIFGFWQAMSQASTATSTESIEEVVLTTVAPDINTLPLELPRDLGDNIHLVGFSISQNSALASSQFDQLLQVNLSWETTGQPTADYTAFVHLLDADGNLVAQADQSLGETSTFANGTRVDASFDLALPDTPGTYLFTTGLYDSNTGQQLLDLQGLALTLFEVPANGLLTQLPAELGDSFRLLDFSLSTNQFVPGQPLQISLSWETTGRPTADYTAFVHLVDQSGNLLAQTDQSLGASSTFVNGTRPNTNLTLWLPDDLPPGTFSIVIGLYDSTTGQQLPADRPGLYMVQIEVPVDTAVIPSAVVSGTDDNGLTLRRTPTSQSIAILSEGSIVSLLDEPLMESEGLLWQAIKTNDGQMGWVVAEFLTYPEDYRPADTMPWSPDGLWIVKATQLPRSNADEAITLEVTVGYELVTAEEAVLSLSFVHPTWGESLEGYRYPTYNALGNERRVQAGTGNVTFTVSVEPETITSAIYSDEFGLITRLWATDEDDQQTSDLILIGFDKGISFNVQSVEEIAFEGGGLPIDANASPAEETGPVYLESVVQKERHTAVVTFEVIIEQPILDATFQLFLVNPDWDFDQTNIQWFQYFMAQPGQPGLSITATPDQIREATNTDHPIVAAIVEPLDPSNGTAIVQKFPQFPFDLTSNEEIRYTPVNDTTNRNYLEIIELSPPVGSTLRNETTFTVTVKYNLVSLDTAEIFTLLLPYQGGDAIVGDDVQTISRGQGELTFSFNFEPLETRTTSDWLLELRMHDPAEGISPSALATTMPHDNFPNDLYHFEP